MYELSLPAFIWGLVALIISVLFIRFHRVIADNFGGGVGSYERYKLWGLIGCGFSLLLMVNLPAFLLELALGSIFRF